MKKTFATLAAFFCIYNISFAQDTTVFKKSKIAIKKSDYKFALRVMPLSLIDFIQPSVTIGGEYKIDENISFGLDCSYLIPLIQSETNFYVNKGFILKPSVRIYLNANKKSRLATYFEPDFFWKRIYNERSEWMPIYLPNGNLGYHQQKLFTELKEVLGVNMKFGIQQSIIGDNILMEVYGGAGLRTIYRSVADEPNFIPSENRSFFSFEPSYHKRLTIPSITFGVRFVFIIK
jgi:hypothetical protein